MDTVRTACLPDMTDARQMNAACPQVADETRVACVVIGICLANEMQYDFAPVIDIWAGDPSWFCRTGSLGNAHEQKCFIPKLCCSRVESAYHLEIGLRGTHLCELVVSAVSAELTPNLTSLLPGEVTVEPLPDGLARITARLVEGKSAVYRACIQSGIRDLSRSIRNPVNVPAVTLKHGIESLQLAVEAEALGRRSRL